MTTTRTRQPRQPHPTDLARCTRCSEVYQLRHLQGGLCCLCQADLARKPAAAPAAVATATPAGPAPTLADLDRAFDALDTGDGVVWLSDLRLALGCPRPAFDLLLEQARREGRFTAMGAERAETPERMAAGIREPGDCGRLLVAVARRV